jgi:hypothetical protein
MHSDEPEDRIAELERQLAEQKRIAELERQLAEAKAARQAQAGWQAPHVPDAQAAAGWGGEERARQYAEGLWEFAVRWDRAPRRPFRVRDGPASGGVHARRGTGGPVAGPD